MDTITYANTHISTHACPWIAPNQRLCGAVFSMASGMCAHNTGGEEAGWRQGKVERKWRKTGANKQNKLGKALCWAGAGTGVRACVCEAIWTEWRGLGQILGCPTHSWLMIQSWSTAQRTSRRGTPGCVHASVCLCLCVQACGFDWCVYQCAHLQACSCTNKLVCVSVCVCMC